MLLRYALLVCVLFSTSGCAYFLSQETLDMVEKPAPNNQLVMLDGSTKRISNYRGKTLVLAFWYTSCPYSRPQLRQLDDYAETIEDRSDIAFVAVSIDKEKKREFLEGMARSEDYDNFQHAFSGKDVYDRTYSSYYLSAVPAFVVIDPQGVIKTITRDADEVIALVN